MNVIDEVSLSTGIFPRDVEGEPGRLGEYLDMAAEAGFKMIELSRRQRPGEVEVIRRSGLKVWSIHGIYLGPYMEGEEAFERGIDKACERLEPLVEYAPCPVVEHYLDRFNDPSYGVAFRKAIEKLYQRYHEMGFILCVETAPYKPLENERYPDSKEISDFVRSFNQPDLLMTIDINHSNLHEDLEKVCANCQGLIRNIHVSDNHGGYEDHLPPGEGIIDLKKTFAALRRNGYTGPCNVECHMPGRGLPSVEKLRGIREYVENLLWERK